MMGLLKRVRLAYKRWLARHRTIVEFCKDCGVEQPVVWTAPDGLWVEIWGNAGGILCPTCFDRRAERLGYFLRWVPQVETVTVGSANVMSVTYGGTALTRVAEGRGIEPRRE